MISQNQILRLVEAQEHRQLVVRVLANGRCRSEMARRVLTSPHAAPVASLGLALQRLGEIEYQHSGATDRLVCRLLDMQRDDGLLGQSDQPVDDALIGASAAALRGLMMWAAADRGNHNGLARSANRAVAHGLDALRHLYVLHSAKNAAFGAGWAIALWQLGDVEAFRKAIPVKDLLATLDESSAELVEDELCRYAHAMAA